MKTNIESPEKRSSDPPETLSERCLRLQHIVGGGDSEVGESKEDVRTKENGASRNNSRRKRNRGSRRGRGRKRKGKPYSQMTWREKRDLEILDEIRDEKREQKKRKLEAIPKDSDGRILSGVNAKDYRPGAPKNTTQYLLEKSDVTGGETSTVSPVQVVDDDLEFEGENLDDMGTMSMVPQNSQEEKNNSGENDMMMFTIRKQSDLIKSLQQQRDQDVKESVLMKQRINRLEVTLRDLNKKFEKIRRSLPPENSTDGDNRNMGGNNSSSSSGRRVRHTSGMSGNDTGGSRKSGAGGRRRGGRRRGGSD